MWNPFRRDKAAQQKADEAIRDAQALAAKIEEEIDKDKQQAAALRQIRKVNHLAEKFDEAFASRRRGEDS